MAWNEWKGQTQNITPLLIICSYPTKQNKPNQCGDQVLTVEPPFKPEQVSAGSPCQAMRTHTYKHVGANDRTSDPQNSRSTHHIAQPTSTQPLTFPPSPTEKTTQRQLLRYIRYARSLSPQITEESRRKLVTCYRCVLSLDMWICVCV